MTHPEYRAVLLLLLHVMGRVHNRVDLYIGELTARELMRMMHQELEEEYRRIGGVI